jgi:hypothetical protein
VPDFHLVVGNPARSIGCVCRCGEPLMKWSEGPAETDGQDEPAHVVSCRACGLAFQIVGRAVTEVVDELAAQTSR